VSRRLYRVLPHLSFFSSLFPYLSPPLLIFSFENRPGPVSRPDVVRQLNLAFLFILCFSSFLLIGECVLLLC